MCNSYTCICACSKLVMVVDVCLYVQEKEEGNDEKKPKYCARPPRDLTSKFLQREEQKITDSKMAEEQKKKEEEAARLAVSSY